MSGSGSIVSSIMLLSAILFSSFLRLRQKWQHKKLRPELPQQARVELPQHALAKVVIRVMHPVKEAPLPRQHTAKSAAVVPATQHSSTKPPITEPAIIPALLSVGSS